ncbi:MAG TPA: sulfite exporter TauE/SafE family protein [Microvirga sp.]|jgi:hypothetical protein|nr:sulfite exporter TauE/SafE family protein [Microvirga sp.]
MAAGLTLQLLGVVWLGAFTGALAAGGAGFAFALTASAIWLHVLDPLQTTMLVVACGTILHLTLVWPMRRSIELARFWPFAAGGLIGIPVGVALLTQADVSRLKAAVGAFLVVYGLYALLAPRLPQVRGGGRAADAMVGFFGGVLGGLGGLSGVLPTIWTQLRGWPKDMARGVFQPFILMAHAATLAILGTAAPDSGGLLLVACALPALGLGAWLGWSIYGRLDERRFRRLLAGLLLVSGLALVI